ncbi:lipoprotein [Geomonas sp. Red276]
MRGSIHHLLSILVLAAGLAGCVRSPQVSFYTLDTFATAAAAPRTSGGRSVAIGPITLPELVDRPQLVVRTGENRVEILETDRWAEPLKSEMPGFLAGQVARELGSEHVFSYRHVAGASAEYRVAIDVVRMDAVAGDAVTLEANWSVRHTGPAGKTRHSLIRDKVQGPGYDAVVAAYSRALASLGREIAAALREEGALQPPQ